MKNDFISRLVDERDVVSARLDKLFKFIKSDDYRKLSKYQADLLLIQSNFMVGYRFILELRLEDLEDYE